MITNLPTVEEYKDVSAKWFFQAKELICEHQHQVELIKFDKLKIILNQTQLSTSVILLFQSIESFLKAEICKITPLLLVDLKPNDWPTLPNSKNKEFNELYTINGESLKRMFCAFNNDESENKAFIEIYDEIRVKRNQMAHGIYADKLSLEDLLELLLRAAPIIFKTDLFQSSLNYDKVYFEDISDFYTQRYYRLNFFEQILGVKKVKKYLGVNGRAFWCYKCRNHISVYETKTAYLFPNKPNGDTVKCLVCQGLDKVKRKDCIEESCKGNVLLPIKRNQNICLTCNDDNN